MKRVTTIKEAISYFRLSVREIRPIEEESYSSTVRILVLESGEKCVLKIPYNPQKLLRERNVLSILEDTLLVPKVLNSWERDDGIPGALLLSWFPGRPITGTISPDLACKTGRLLGMLHTHTLRGFGDIFRKKESASSDWWATLDHGFQWWTRFCEPLIDKKLFRDVTQLVITYEVS